MTSAMHGDCGIAGSRTSEGHFDAGGHGFLDNKN